MKYYLFMRWLQSHNPEMYVKYSELIAIPADFGEMQFNELNVGPENVDELTEIVNIFNSSY